MAASKKARGMNPRAKAYLKKKAKGQGTTRSTGNGLGRKRRSY